MSTPKKTETGRREHANERRAALARVDRLESDLIRLSMSVVVAETAVECALTDYKAACARTEETRAALKAAVLELSNLRAALA
jgi:hypothetical protein